MNQSPRRNTSGDIVIADGEELNLRNRYVAAFLAWLIPGAGHYYQRRYLKSAVFFVCIMSSFMIGMLVGGGRCVCILEPNGKRRSATPPAPSANGTSARATATSPTSAASTPPTASTRSASRAKAPTARRPNPYRNGKVAEAPKNYMEAHE